MRSLILFFAALALAVSFSGCQTPAKSQVWMEQLEQEIRDKEDYIYDLEAENDRLCKELERAERKTNAGSAGTPFEPRKPAERRSILPLTPREKPTPPVPPEALEEPKIEGLGMPEAETPAPKSTVPGLPRITPSPAAPLVPPGTPGAGGGAKAAPSLSVPPDELPAPSEATPTKATPQEEELDPNVNHIRVNPTHTSGYDVDGASGDDGIKVMLEPRNKEERFVPLPAPVSIVVLDPAEQGESQRLARWDFTAAQVDEALAAALPEKGLMFQLPWSETMPKHSKLKVCVRFVAPGGEKLETQHDVFVALPGQISHRWTPATSSKRALAQEAPLTATPASLETPADPAADPAPLEHPEPVAPPVSRSTRRSLWRPFR